uniref:Uncharacterized protein n=1 Tax=Siphoviridae sp. cthrG7 TaxID=2826428 RepID=A0A8S5MBZ7_9CAUD|nr:MAG TPA: hypothetical protein [Siphoviridae sp. cthrG7]
MYNPIFLILQSINNQQPFRNKYVRDNSPHSDKIRVSLLRFRKLTLIFLNSRDEIGTAGITY